LDEVAESVDREMKRLITISLILTALSGAAFPRAAEVSRRNLRAKPDRGLIEKTAQRLKAAVLPARNGGVVLGKTMALIVSASTTTSMLRQRNLPSHLQRLSVREPIVKPNFDVKSYIIMLRIDPVAKSISGSVTVGATVASPRLRKISLDLADSLTVDSVESDGHSLKFTHDRNLVTMDLRHGYQRGSRFEVKVNYHGQPKGDGFSFGEHQSIPMISTYGLPFTAQQWWPCKDTPLDKADSVDLILTVPSPLVAASNGKLIREKKNDDGTRTFHWSVRYPIYPDTVSLAVTNYETFTLPYEYSPTRSMPMVFYVYPEDLSKAKTDFSVLPDIMNTYAAIFGPYPFLREKYGVAEFSVNSFREHQTLPSYGAPRITGDHKNDFILAHELAHQWFGNSISVKSWSDVWLNEGFATYGYALWRERHDGKTAYFQAMKKWDRADFAGSVFVEDPKDQDKLFSATTFYKGAWVLHMLRHVMGDKAFFRALRNYVRAFSYRNAGTDDFKTACEKEYGHPLDWFFQEWIYRTGRPEYKYQWSVSRGGAKSVLMLTLDQTQTDTGTFRMPLDLVVTTSQGQKTFVIWDELKSQNFEFSLGEGVTQVTLDPDGWILKKLSQ
jgi:aminopeptidase N